MDLDKQHRFFFLDQDYQSKLGKENSQNATDQKFFFFCRFVNFKHTNKNQ